MDLDRRASASAETFFPLPRLSTTDNKVLISTVQVIVPIRHDAFHVEQEESRARASDGG